MNNVMGLFTKIYICPWVQNSKDYNVCWYREAVVVAFSGFELGIGPRWLGSQYPFVNIIFGRIKIGPKLGLLE